MTFRDKCAELPGLRVIFTIHVTICRGRERPELWVSLRGGLRAWVQASVCWERGVLGRARWKLRSLQAAA